MVHRREVDGEAVVFGNQGALWENAMTWWDHDTGSIWSQPLGEALAGPRRGERLELFPSVLTTWADWSAAHPETLALDAGGGTGGFRLDRMVVVVDFTTEAAAYRLRDLWEAGVVNDVVAGAPIAVVADPAAPERWSVLSRVVGDATVTLDAVDGRLVDRETGTQWDPVRGRALEGPLRGQALGLLPGFTAFPWDFERIWPQGRLWPDIGIVDARGLLGFVTQSRD